MHLHRVDSVAAASRPRFLAAALIVGSLVGGLVAALDLTGGPGGTTAISFAQAEEDGVAEGDAAARGGGNTLAAVRSAVELLDRSAVLEGTQGELGVRLSIYQDAWQRHALAELAQLLAAGKSAADASRELREAPGIRRRLQGKMAFRLTLHHPRLEVAPRRGKVQPVHFLRGAEALVLRVGRRPVRWQALKEAGLEQVRLRMARHSTVKDGKPVPFVGPVKPETPRLVFQGLEASFWGVLPPVLRDAEEGTLTLSLRYEEYHGTYDDEHIIDMNDAAHRFEQDLELTAERPLPLLFPALPAEVEELLSRCEGNEE